MKIDSFLFIHNSGPYLTSDHWFVKKNINQLAKIILQCAYLFTLIFYGLLHIFVMFWS